MEKHIGQIEALIAENKAITENRTAFIEVALGGLRTALENAREHVIATKPQAATETTAPTKKTKA